MMELDGLSLEYKRDNGTARRHLDVSDLVNNPVASGKCRVLGLGLTKESLDRAITYLTNPEAVWEAPGHQQISWPWELRECALVDLFEMLFPYGWLTAIVGASFREIECELWKREAAGVHGLLKSDDYAAVIRRHLQLAETVFKRVPLPHLLPELARMIAATEDTPIHVGQLHTQVASMRRLFQDGLKTHKFLYVSPSDAEIYEAEQPFGEEVAAAFQKLTFDLSEAGKCLAVGRFTACVFHLMRVMEHSVQQFGRKLRVPVNPATDTWHDIMGAVNKKINPMKKGPKKALYGSVAAHLDHVRIAWRNEVMHPKATYTREEAQAIWDAVKAFMGSFVKL